MATWVELLKSSMLAAMAAGLLRYALVATIVIWSFKADPAGKRHALALLRLLRAQRWIGRDRRSAQDKPVKAGKPLF